MSPSGQGVCLCSIPTPHVGVAIIAHKALAITPISETGRISDKSQRAGPEGQAWCPLQSWALPITVPS